MPSSQQFTVQRLNSDLGLLILVLFVSILCLLIGFAWRRWKLVQVVGRAAFPLLIPFAAWQAGAGYALVAASASVIAPRIKPSRFAASKFAVPALVALALLARLPMLNDSWWYDEAYTWRVINLPLAQLPAAILADVHPPLFYLVMWIWQHLIGSGSEAIIRLPVLLMSLVQIPLIVRLATAAGLNRHAALAAGALIAVFASAAYYGVELRFYCFLTVFVWLALLGILDDRPRLFAVSAALIGLTHNLGLFYLVILFPAVWLYGRRRRGWLAAMAGAGMVALLWIPVMLRQTSTIVDGFWLSFNLGTTMLPLLLHARTVPQDLLWSAVAPLIALEIGCWYIARRWLAMRPARLILAVMLAVPSAVAVASALWHPVYLARPFLPLALLIALPLGIALSESRERRLIRAVAVPVLLLIAMPFYANYGGRPHYREGIAAGCQGADAFYATAIHTAFIVAPYWHGPMLVWPLASDDGGTFTPAQMPIYGFQVGQFKDLSGQRICIVLIDTPRTTDLERQTVAALADHYPHTNREIYVNPEQVLHFYVLDV